MTATRSTAPRHCLLAIAMLAALPTFDGRGVPIEVNMGPWEVDGGSAYWVRSFEPGS